MFFSFSHSDTQDHVQAFGKGSDEEISVREDTEDSFCVAGLVSPTVAARHEELKKKRQILNNSGAEMPETVSDTERAK